MSQQPCLPLPRRRKRPNDPSDPTASAETIRISDVAQNMDAMSYLASVREEAEHFPSVFVVSSQVMTDVHPDGRTLDSFIPIDGSAAATEYLLSHRTQILPPPTPAHLPCYHRSMESHTTNGLSENQYRENHSKCMTKEEWIRVTMANFSTLRLYLSQCREAGLGSKQFTMEDETMTLRERIPVPTSKDRSGWHIFCLGKDEAMGNVGGYFHDDNDSEGDADDDDDTDNENEEEEYDGNSANLPLFLKDNAEISRVEGQNHNWDVKSVPPKGYFPTTELLCQFDQILTRRVLSHHVYYLHEGWDMTPSRGIWMYALLSRLEKPLHRDDASLLRQLLWHLCYLRSRISLVSSNHDGLAETISLSSQEKLSVLNVLITIVGFYFEQCGPSDGVMSSPIC